MNGSYNCYTYWRTKVQKYDKLLAELSEEMPRNKLLVDLIDHMDVKILVYVILKMERNNVNT